jgi:hypothetical protein
LQVGRAIDQIGALVHPTVGSCRAAENVMSASSPPPIEVFISYSHNKKDAALREQLETTLALLKRQSIIDLWHDRRIGAGREWAGAIDEHLNSAAVILLLVS